jgi:ribosomal protein L40E
LNSLEAIAAVLLAGAVLWLVLQPLIQSGGVAPTPVEPLDPEETPVGVALTALKDIEFDRETGKLSSADYEQLKQKYTAAAVAAMRAEQATGPEGVPGDVEAMVAARLRVLRGAKGATPPGAPACLRCGPRPEPDAVFCSTCGGRLQAHWACGRCGATLPPDSIFCERCGSRVAA